MILDKPALAAPPSGLQLPGVGRARRTIDCRGRRRRRRRRRRRGAGGLGLHRTASVGVTAGCRRWCTTHHPPTHPQAKATRTLKTLREPHHAFMIKLKITIMVGGSFKTRLIGFLFLKGTMRLIHWAGRVPLADA